MIFSFDRSCFFQKSDHAKRFWFRCRINSGLFALCGILLSTQAHGGFNFGDALNQAREKIDSIVLPIKDYLAQPVVKPVFDTIPMPEVINPENFEFDVDDVGIPDGYNSDLGQIIVLSDLLSYLSLLPEIWQESIPLVHDQSYQQLDFNDPNAWFVFYNDGEQAIDIEIKSKIKLSYDVLNQEGNSVLLSKSGGLEAGMPAGFYFIRVLNYAIYNEEDLFPVARSNLVDFNFSIKIVQRDIEGAVITGFVTDACTNEAISRAAISLGSDYVYSHSDGSYAFVGQTPASQSLYAYAEGYKTGHAGLEITADRNLEADFLLFPLDGCPAISIAEDKDRELVDNRIMPLYDEVNGIVNFIDVKAVGLPGGDHHFRAQLSQVSTIEKLSFNLTQLHEIDSSNQNVTAVYDYSQSSLSINELLAFGKRFNVKLEHDQDFVFSVVELLELE